MPLPVPIRAFHPAALDLAAVVSGLLELDPDDHAPWHVLFTELDQRVPRSLATYEVIGQLVRAIDAHAGDEEAEARRLMAAARANRARARRLREYVLGEVTGAGLDRMDGVQVSPNAAGEPPVLRVVGGTAAARERAAAAERADVREAARPRVQALEAPLDWKPRAVGSLDSSPGSASAGEPLCLFSHNGARSRDSAGPSDHRASPILPPCKSSH